MAVSHKTAFERGGGKGSGLCIFPFFVPGHSIRRPFVDFSLRDVLR